MTMETYGMIVQEFDNNISEGTRQFEKRLNCLKRRHSRSTSMNLAKAAIASFTQSNNSVDTVPREPFTDPTWWDVFVEERYAEVLCVEYLHCSRKTYNHLVKTLRPHIRPKSTAPIETQTSTEKQVALMLYKIGHCSDYNDISRMFGVSNTTIHNTMYKVMNAANNYILRNVIKMPKAEEARKIAKQLENITMIPQLLGTLESTHIPTCKNSSIQFLNKQNYKSIIMQTVVDASSCFRDVSVRHPGKTDDHLVLEDSSIYKHHKRVIPSDTGIMGDLKIPYKLVASSTYPMLPWLLTEYGPALTSAEKAFNNQLRIARWSSNKAISRLRARFAILTHSLDMSCKIAPQVIAVCCAIHNICEKNGDPFLEEWRVESKKYKVKYPQPRRTRDMRTINPNDLALRDAIRDNLEAKLVLAGCDFMTFDREELQNVEVRPRSYNLRNRRPNWPS